MIKIKKLEKFAYPIHVTTGDYFILKINDSEIHREEILEKRTITCWAYVEIGMSGIGYLIGDDNLEQELLKCAPQPT